MGDPVLAAAATKIEDENYEVDAPSLFPFGDYNNINSSSTAGFFEGNIIKDSLLIHAAEKLLLSRKSGPLDLSNFDPPSSPNHDPKQRNKLPLCKKLFFDPKPEEDVKNFPLISSSDTNTNIGTVIITSLAALLFKLAGYQLTLFLRFFLTLLLPICSNSSRCFLNLTCVMCAVVSPFQALVRTVRKTLRARRAPTGCCSNAGITSLWMRCAARLSRGLVCAVCTWMLLVGLLIVGFTISGILMGTVVERSVHAREALSFDYTRSSPAAAVHAPPPPDSSSNRRPAVFKTTIPSHHKLWITVSLTLPESEYNRNLGIFQLGSSGELVVYQERISDLKLEPAHDAAIQEQRNPHHGGATPQRANPNGLQVPSPDPRSYSAACRTDHASIRSTSSTAARRQ
ncbi:uncharacterized protein LOC127253962 isoform X2 [Andrographis paniculata]|uniref:uncharacterized protein LOC127253962 isoform X2 n=1 Tax=Andrographis paniculata TaxID=175694 RepID=UPI0021E97EB6|nr:uncharacterized protein LOC127253962 isoform X2 [Andrographis paniculata]